MIDKDEAIRLLRKEVANKGEEFVYRSPIEPHLEPGLGQCVYFHEGQPSCIVGHALDNYLTDDQKFAIDHENGNPNVTDCLMPMLFPGRLDVDPNAAAIFAVAQREQDNGKSWGYSLEMAESVYRRLGGTE